MQKRQHAMYGVRTTQARTDSKPNNNTRPTDQETSTQKSERGSTAASSNTAARAHGGPGSKHASLGPALTHAMQGTRAGSLRAGQHTVPQAEHILQASMLLCCVKMTDTATQPSVIIILLLKHTLPAQRAPPRTHAGQQQQQQPQALHSSTHTCTEAACTKLCFKLRRPPPRG